MTGRNTNATSSKFLSQEHKPCIADDDLGRSIQSDQPGCDSCVGREVGNDFGLYARDGLRHITCHFPIHNNFDVERHVS